MGEILKNGVWNMVPCIVYYEIMITLRVLTL